MTTLATYRTTVNSMLASVPDASIWTNAIIDEAIRMSINAFDDVVVYEESATIASTSNTQNIGSLVTALQSIVSLHYPYLTGEKFLHQKTHYTLTAYNTAFFPTAAPVAGQTIRIRYCKAHTLTDLDSAASTTIPTNAQRLICLGATAYALELRARQAAENPAIPRESYQHLLKLAQQKQDDFQQRLVKIAGRFQNPTWPDIGL